MVLCRGCRIASPYTDIRKDTLAMTRLRFSLPAVLLLLALIPHAARAQGYVVADLGGLESPSHYPSTYAYGVNDSGQVTGRATILENNTPLHAFLYSNGTMTDLGSLGGNTANSTGYAINASGQVAGTSDKGDGTLRAFLSSNGVLTGLGTLGGTSSYGYGLNDSGQVVGGSYTATGAFHAFLYANNAMVSLGTLGGSTSFANAISNSGQVTGASNVTGNKAQHAFLYANGAMTDLGTLGGDSSVGSALNDSGQVAGTSFLRDNKTQHAVLWQGGAMTDLGTLPNYASSFAYGINSAGQIVGQSSYNLFYPGHAFLYADGTITDLNTRIDPRTHWTLYTATAISNTGLIVGYGLHNINGTTHAFLLTPRNGVPAIYSLNPNRAFAGSSAHTLTVYGTDFLSGAVVQWNGAALATTFLSSTQLQATVPYALTRTPGTALVMVVNPSGAASESEPFTIKPRLAAFTLSQSTVRGGSSLTGTVTLSQAAPSDGEKVTLSVSGSAPVGVPRYVMVSARAASVTFSIGTGSVAQISTATITATAGAVKSQLLTVTP